MLIISRNLVLTPSIWHPDLQSALSILPGKWLYILPVFMLASLYFLSQTTHVQQRDTDLDGLPAIWSSKDFYSELSDFEYCPQAVPKLKDLHS